MPNHPNHLILDFDGTLTTTSTLPLIYDIGYRLNPSSPSWNSIYRAYIDDYNELKVSYSKHRTTLSQELDWLEHLRVIEYRSIARVEATKVFRGVTKDVMHAAAEGVTKDGKLELRKGWEKLVTMVMEEEGKVSVVSVGWSAAFIRGCLSAASRLVRPDREDDASEKSFHIEHINVRANEVLDDEEGRMERYWKAAASDDRTRILTAADKFRVMTDTVGRDHHERPGQLVIYVGDSTTDLECLLHADIGICLRGEANTMTGEQKELQGTLDRVGLVCRWMGTIKKDDMKARSTSRVHNNSLWWAKDFDEIYRSMLFSTSGNIKDNDNYRSSHSVVRSARFEINKFTESTLVYQLT
ncbi:MAG: hypothetical protein Q9209_006001 [Squamulea sp. 1 TL-2023]